jgi:tetratricopeptide (TPR) repeat protein
MPTVVNGIGTWYYGRRRIHRRKGTCAFCRRVVELESHDTTLYFCVFFVPLIPLGQKRILDQCPVCRRHRVTSLAQWEASKAADIARLLEKLQQDPDDRDTILSGLALATAYQDPALLDKLADSLAKHRTDDPAIQAQLGAAYDYFARHAEAEAAYRAALAVDDTPEVRRRLALTLLKQGRPGEAQPYLRHILDERVGEDAGMLFLLAEGYQAEGQHQEALDFMDQRDAVFPALAATKEWQRQRKTSERYLHSGKKVRPTYLDQSPRAGYREGSPWAVYIPRIIAPALVLGLLCWYLGAALWLGQARPVFLVNGTERPYTVAVNGRDYALAAGAATPVRVTEGEVTVAFRDGNPPPEPVRCRVETPFFSRPFGRHTFVINPDQLALVVRDEAVYAANPGQDHTPAEFHVGRPFYAFEGIDYEFAPFPDSVEVTEGGQVRKTRVALVPGPTSEVRVRVVSQVLGPEQQKEYARRLLDRNPEDSVALAYLVSLLGEEERLALLRSRLGDRPLRVDWHRAYQILIETDHPDRDLRPEYRQLVQETGRQPDALYLLARVSDEDPDGADRLLREAAAATPPSAYALHALGVHALEQGELKEAVGWAQRAVALAPDNVIFQEGERTALLAAGQYQALLDLLGRRRVVPARRLGAIVDEVRVRGLQGDEAGARALFPQAMRMVINPTDRKPWDATEANLEAALACARHDTARFLEWADRAPDVSPFAPALLRGRLREASGHVAPDPDAALTQHALLYQAATKSGDKKLADAQWAALLTALTHGRGATHRLGEVLAGRQPLRAEDVRRMWILVEQKRVLVAVVARRYPEAGKELLPLARKLDFLPDPTSLCLRKVLE